MMQPDEIKQRNIDEGRSYRNVIEFTEHGYRFKPEVDVVNVPERPVYRTGESGCVGVYAELHIADEKYRKPNLREFVEFLHDKLEGVAEDKKDAVISHYLVGTRVDQQRQSKIFLTPEAQELFKSYFTQSHAGYASTRLAMMREEELHFQRSLKKGVYVSDPLPEKVEDFLLVPSPRADEFSAKDVMERLGIKKTYTAVSDILERKAVNEAIFLALDDIMPTLLEEPTFKVQAQLLKDTLDARVAKDANDVTLRDVHPLMKEMIQSKPKSASMEVRKAVTVLADIVRDKESFYYALPATVKREAELNISLDIGGLRKVGENRYEHYLTEKGLRHIAAVRGVQDGAPDAQTREQGDVQLAHGKGASKTERLG
jgi:hypothetical protein